MTPHERLGYSLLKLLLVLCGLCIIIGGPNLARRFLGFLVSPIFWLAEWAWRFLVGGAILVMLLMYSWQHLQPVVQKYFPKLPTTIDAPTPTPTPIAKPKEPAVSISFDYPVGDLEPNGRRRGKGWRVDQDFARDNDFPHGRPKLAGKHLGEDWNKGEGAEDAGEKVYSIGPGVVIRAEENEFYGHYVMILHALPSNSQPRFVVSLYGHLATQDLISKGSEVKRGETIGHIGALYDNGYYHAKNSDESPQLDESGNQIRIPWPVHLHFEIRVPTKTFSYDEIGVYGYSDDHDGFVNPTDATSEKNSPGGGWIDAHRNL